MLLPIICLFVLGVVRVSCYLTNPNQIYYVYFPDEREPYIDRTWAQPIGVLTARMARIVGPNGCIVLWSGTYGDPTGVIAAPAGANQATLLQRAQAALQRFQQDNNLFINLPRVSVVERAHEIADLLSNPVTPGQVSHIPVGQQGRTCWTLESLLDEATKAQQPHPTNNPNTNDNGGDCYVPPMTNWGPREIRIWTHLSKFFVGLARGDVHYVRGTKVRVANVFEKDEYPELVALGHFSGTVHKYHWSFGRMDLGPLASHSVSTYSGPGLHLIDALRRRRAARRETAQIAAYRARQQAVITQFAANPNLPYVLRKRSLYGELTVGTRQSHVINR
jgi:hypothetical protein